MSKFDIANEMSSIMGGTQFRTVFSKPALTKTAASKEDAEKAKAAKEKEKAKAEKEKAKAAKACVAEAKRIIKKHNCKGTAKLEDGGCVVTIKGDRKDCSAAKKEIAEFCKSNKCKCKCTVEKTASDYQKCVLGLAKISEILDNNGFEKQAADVLITLESLVSKAAPTGQLGSNTSGVNDCGSDMGYAKGPKKEDDDDKEDKSEDSKKDKDDKKVPLFMKKKDDDDDEDDEDDDESDAKGPKKSDDKKKDDDDEDDKDKGNKKDDDDDDEDDDDESDAFDMNWETDPALDVRIPVGKGDDEEEFAKMMESVESATPDIEGEGSLDDMFSDLFEDEDIRAKMDELGGDFDSEVPEAMGDEIDEDETPEEFVFDSISNASSKKSSLQKLADELKKNFLA